MAEQFNSPVVDEGQNEILVADMARLLETDSSVATAFLDNAVEQGMPDLYVEGWAALQRGYATGLVEEREYRHELRRARRFIEKSGQWDVALEHVAEGQPTLGELQLVTWSAQPLRSELQMHPTPMKYRALGKIGLGDVPVVESLQAGHTQATWTALRRYVLHRPDGGQEFNSPATHLLAVAQMDIIRRSGLLDDLDVTRPNPVLRAMGSQLQSYIDLTRRGGIQRGMTLGSGEPNALPHSVVFMAKALRQYDEDAIAYQHGNAAVVHMQGRLWQFIERPDSRNDYEKHLIQRSQQRGYGDERLAAYSGLETRGFEGLLHDRLRAIFRIPSGGTTPDQVIQLHEELGATWAVMTLRKHEPGMHQIMQRYHQQVKQVLEPYVVDGLPLVANRAAPVWLTAITLESWYGADPVASVFTAAYGAIHEDRRIAGEALSSNIRARLGHNNKRNPDNTWSQGYAAEAPQIGVVMSFCLYRDLLRHSREHAISGTVLRGAANAFWQSVANISKKDWSRVTFGLPADVREVINNRHLPAH